MKRESAAKCPNPDCVAVLLIFYDTNIKSTIRGTFQVGEVLSSITLSLFEIFQPNLVNLYYLRHFLKLC